MRCPAHSATVGRSGEKIREEGIVVITPVENNAYRVRHHKVDAEIGDCTKIGFKPWMVLKSWNGEKRLGIGKRNITSLPSIAGDKISAAFGVGIRISFELRSPIVKSVTALGRIYDFVQNEEGGLELKFQFTKRPPKNYLELTLETEGMVFHKQPALHLDHPTWIDRDGDGVADEVCAENVPGSYAVYADGPLGVWASPAEAEMKKTGKLWHIYRPLLIDAEGREAWCDLNIDVAKGKFRIDFPADFLDTAVYPVTLDPNFGKETLGQYNYQIEEHKIAGIYATCPESGTAQSISLYLQNSGVSVPKMKCALYKKSDSSFVDGTEEWEMPGGGFGPEWKTFSNLTASITAIDYCIVTWGDDNFNLYRDWVNDSYCYQLLTYGTWPNPATFSTSGYQCSMYCTYETEGPPEGQPYISRVQGIPGMRTWGGIR